MESLKIISLNILAQHLVDGECPSYKHVNNPYDPTILQTIRLQCLEGFIKDVGIFDFLNLQEVGPLDIEMVNKLVA